MQLGDGHEKWAADEVRAFFFPFGSGVALRLRLLGRVVLRNGIEEGPPKRTVELSA